MRRKPPSFRAEMYSSPVIPSLMPPTGSWHLLSPMGLLGSMRRISELDKKRHRRTLRLGSRNLAIGKCIGNTSSVVTAYHSSRLAKRTRPQRARSAAVITRWRATPTAVAPAATENPRWSRGGERPNGGAYHLLIISSGTESSLSCWYDEERHD